MNEDLDLIQILERVPSGTNFWSPICGDCTFKRIDYDPDTDYPIVCLAECIDGELDIVAFTDKGVYDNRYVHGDCALFPSKDNLDWSSFSIPKASKEFKPFQKVLCAINDDGYKIWSADFYSHYNEETKQHYLVSGVVKVDADDVIPYEGNENLLGKEVEQN